MAALKQSTAYTRMVLLVQSSDHITGLTGASPTVTLSKAGAAFGALGGSVTEVSSGWYKISLNTTDTGTLGDLAYHVTATSADPSDFVDQVTARLLDDLAYPATSGRSMVVDAAGLVDANMVKAGPTGSGSAQTARDLGQGIPNAVPGAAGGLFIAGANAATSITTALTANVIGNITGNLSGSVGSVTGAVGSVTGAVGSVTAAVTITAASVQAIWDALTAALTTVGSIGKLLVTNIDATISSRAATGAAMTLTAGERTSIADAMLDEAAGIETGVTVRQGLRGMVATLLGKLSGAAGTTILIRDTGDTKNRVSATVDSSGNRSAVTLDLT